MSLNIKNDDVHAAVRELALRLGMSQTSAVEIAVREKLAQLSDAATRADRGDRVRRAVAAAQHDFAGVDLRLTEAGLYDSATGLPR